MAKRRRKAARSPAHTQRRVEGLGKARAEALRFLNEAQAWELDEIVQRLGDLDREEEVWDLDIAKLSDPRINLLIVKGGVFGSKIVEVFFGFGGDGEVAVLGVTEGNPKRSPPWFRIEKMANRLSHYLRITK